MTHDGAFGEDFDSIPPSTFKRLVDIPKSSFDPTQTEWVAVWKFPYDLNYLPGFRRIQDPLPVGNYGFWSDGWWQPPKKVKNLKNLPLTINKDFVEKMRTDMDPDPSVHYLRKRIKNGGEVRAAMISSNYFIEGFWNENPKTKPQIVRMLQTLYEAGVYAFSCYGQHHAIVFYADMSDSDQPQLMTPEKLAELLSDPVRGEKAMSALESATFAQLRKELKQWKLNYISQFHPKGKKKLTAASQS